MLGFIFSFILDLDSGLGSAWITDGFGLGRV